MQKRLSETFLKQFRHNSDTIDHSIDINSCVSSANVLKSLDKHPLLNNESNHCFTMGRRSGMSLAAAKVVLLAVTATAEARLVHRKIRCQAPPKTIRNTEKNSVCIRAKTIKNNWSRDGAGRKDWRSYSPTQGGWGIPVGVGVWHKKCHIAPTPQFFSISLGDANPFPQFFFNSPRGANGFY